MPRQQRQPMIQTAAIALVRVGRRVPGARLVVLNPLVVRAGYLLVTAVGLAWGALLSVGRIEQRGGVIVAKGCPSWAFGRGGTTIGAVYITRSNVSLDVLEHEAVHRAQWQHYGLALLPLYLAAGPVASRNEFEIEAGLARGGYR